MKRNAQELRTGEVDEEAKAALKRNPIAIVVDNVLDTYNVGSIFRLADAVAAEHVYLCGQTLTPPNSRIKKASINTWEWVPWTYTESAVQALKEIKEQRENTHIIAVEQDSRSVPFDTAEYPMPLAIVVGNESYGVSPDVLDMADTIVELPMWGINVSLNVMVSCGIVLYHILSRSKSQI